MRRGLRIPVVCALATVAIVAPSARADSGPALDVPAAALDAALDCPHGVQPEAKPVLLVHGTTSTGPESWSWNYARALPERGISACTVTLPSRSMNDIQVASEFVVAAVRSLAERSGTQVDVIGHSQGNLEPRWALRWWPDVRADVDDFVMLASPNHGTITADAVCAASLCAPALWQMRTSSAFIGALNHGDETPGAVSYTSIYSLTDDLVQPSILRPVARLSGARNVLVQDLCPGRVVHHGQLLADAAAYTVAIDALTHPGPADPARIDRHAACDHVFLPGTSIPDGLTGDAKLYAVGVPTLAGSAMTSAEPPLAPYATAP